MPRYSNNLDTQKKNSESLPSSFSELCLRDQICVAYFSLHRSCGLDSEELNPLLKSFEQEKINSYHSEYDWKIERIFNYLASRTAPNYSFKQELLDSDVWRRTYAYMLGLFTQAWENFNCVALRAYDTKSYAGLRLAHSALYNVPMEWETYFQDDDSNRQNKKLEQLTEMENEDECFPENMYKLLKQNYPPFLKFKKSAVQIRIDENNFHLQQSTVANLADFLTQNTTPIQVNWEDGMNILSMDILRGQWELGGLLKKNTVLPDILESFYAIWRGFKKGSLAEAKNAVERVVQHVMDNGIQYKLGRLSEGSMLVIILASAWTQLDEKLHSQFVEYIDAHNHDGVFNRWSYSEPTQGLANYYDALWHSCCNLKVPAGKGCSWDNLSTLSKIVRNLALSALGSKYKKEDHVVSGLRLQSRLESDYPMLSYWCKRQFATLPILEVSRDLREKLTAIRASLESDKLEHPDWYVPQEKQENKSQDNELVEALRHALGISKALPAKKKTQTESNEAAKRIAWIISLSCYNKKQQWVCDMIPRQYTCKRGVWTIGSGMNQNSLGAKSGYDLNAEEQRLFHTLARFKQGTYGYEPTTLTANNAWLLPKLRHTFVTQGKWVNDRGHIDDNATFTPATFEERLLPITIKEATNGELTITLPDYELHRAFFMEELSKGKYAIYHVTSQMRNLEDLFNNLNHSRTLTLKKELVQQLPGLVDTLSQHFQMDAHLSENTLQQLPTIKGEVQLCLRIHIQGEEYSLTLLNTPIKGEKLVMQPGEGAEQLNCTIKKETILLLRNLKGEKSKRDEFIKAMPELEAWENAPCQWLVTDTPAMLELLEKMRQMPPQLCHLEWDNSKPLHVCAPLTWKNITITASKEGKGWFDLGETVSVDEDKVVSLQQLFAMTHQATGNFLQLDDQTYIRLTSLMRRQLQALSIFAQKGKERFSVSPAALPLMSSFYQNKDTVPEVLEASLKKIGKALKMNPELPSGLQADLRPYQLDGYIWMRRLAQCNLGCCLADDMGIGKTIQALTLLLDIAQAGPSLVIVPASLLAHWHNECLRFTPQLIPQIYTGTEDNRKQLLAAAKPFDLVIVTYGCLQSSIDDFTARSWNCVILDEAQAIKNHETKRARAAKSLRSNFRLALSGTPVENNLLELWSIFDFLNPGILGNEKQFQDKISSFGEGVSPALKRAISPLMLRRTKAEVLAELPEKTEITINVELPKENREQYEALRRNAQLTLAQQDNANRIQILAQLTKLRCYCCHPELAGVDGTASPKLDMLLDLAENLKQAGHRTLVFSQFVKFLDKVRQRFDEAHLNYCYLDGSTPSQKRSEIVEEFNHGKNDFFLISLKAGGLGLNLSSADFVILLDAWWNPAVENQAIDRAHRIGQTRPVTVYRMVCTDTVEEKILALHAKKRFLAEEIFDENQTSSLKLEELLQLI